MKMNCTKRELLEKSIKTSAITVTGKWVAPSILSISLPLHAQATSTPTGNADCSGPSRFSDEFIEYENFNRVLSLFQHTATVGSIQSAVLDYEVRVIGTLLAESRQSNPASATAATTVDLIFQLPDGTVFSERVSASSSLDFQAYDGVEDFMGPSGLTEIMLDDTLSGSIDLITHGIDPSVLTGNGKIDFPVSVSGGTLTLGGSTAEIFFGLTIERTARATITYNDCAL